MKLDDYHSNEAQPRLHSEHINESNQARKEFPELDNAANLALDIQNFRNQLETLKPKFKNKLKTKYKPKTLIIKSKAKTSKNKHKNENTLRFWKSFKESV